MPDYRRVYSAFIESRRALEDQLDCFERHHILPRCLGGSDAPENIIKLVPSEHLFAHVLLAKIHGGKLVTAAVRMSGMRRYRGRKPRERYARLRAKLSADMLGNTRGSAVRHSDEFKRRVGDRNRGVPFAKGWSWSPERIEAHRERMQGNSINRGKKRPHKPETIEKIRAKALARRNCDVQSHV